MPNNAPLTRPRITSDRRVRSVRPAAKAPGVTCWTNTEKKKEPARTRMLTSDTRDAATTVAASTRGTTSDWIGLIPRTRNASSSSRMVRAPRSAHIAVAPAPAMTSTVTTGPTWVTAAVAAPVPEKSAAPNSISRMLRVNTMRTVNGMVSISVGTIDTRATNHVCSRNSRHANGGLNIKTNVSSDMAKKSPTARIGLVAMDSEVTAGSPELHRCLRYAGDVLG